MYADEAYLNLKPYIVFIVQLLYSSYVSHKQGIFQSRLINIDIIRISKPV